MPTSPDTRYSPRNFIKGKIGELVFEEMFRKAGKFTVLPFGYEKNLRLHGRSQISLVSKICLKLDKL